MPNKVTKEIDIKFNNNDLKLLQVSFEQLNKTLFRIQDTLKYLFPKEYRLALRDSALEFNNYKNAIDRTQGALKELNEEEKKVVEPTKKGSSIFNISGKKLINDVVNIIIDPFKLLAKNVKDLTKDMLDLKSGIATWSNESLIFNRNMLDLRMKYGLSSGQAYGFSQASSLLNIKEEDLPYLTSAQKNKFLEYLQKYESFFNKMDQSGVLTNVQELKLEISELKQDLSMEFLTWIANNKDDIMYTLKAIFGLVKTIAQFIMNIVSLIGHKNYDTDTYNNQVNKTSNVNLTINNSASGVQNTRDTFSQFANESWSELAKKIATTDF